MRVEGFVIPVTVDDPAANGLLGEADPSTPGQVCWERSVETLTARKDDLDRERELRRDLAGALAEAGATEIGALRSFIEDDGARLKQLLTQLIAQGTRTLRFQKVHPAEISTELMEMLGFRPAGGHLLYAARARAE